LPFYFAKGSSLIRPTCLTDDNDRQEDKDPNS
jgi:hypothetical protein